MTPVLATAPPAPFTRHLFLVRELVKRDFRGRYAGSVFGFVWSFIQPLWLLALFTFVFSVVIEVSLVGERTESFGLFLFSGLLPWLAVHEGVMRGATAITDNATLVGKLSFPAAILVLAAALSALLHEVIALAVFVVVLALLGERPGVGLALLALAVPLKLALTLGLALALAAVNVFFRDVTQLLGLVLNAWFYLTPIVYPLRLVPEWFRPVIELNPLTAVVGLYRQALLGSGLQLAPGTGALVVIAVLAMILGIVLFRRLEPFFADEV